MMKKTNFVCIALLFVVTKAGFTQTPKPITPKLKGPEPMALNCKSYHNGTFKISYLDKTIIVKRLGATQTEYVSNEKHPVVYHVKWISDCTYKLTPTPETSRYHPDIKKNTVLTVEIVQQNTESFTQIVSANYTKAKVNLEVYPVK